jgi:hypothetical protein
VIEFINNKYKPRVQNGMPLFSKHLSTIWSNILYTIHSGDQSYFVLKDSFEFKVGSVIELGLGMIFWLVTKCFLNSILGYIKFLLNNLVISIV